MTFILALYAAILATFLFGRWVRLEIARRKVRRFIVEENASPEKEIFIEEHPPLTPLRQAIIDMKDEGILEGDVVSEFENELERIERGDIEESVEEREWREEENTRLRYQRR